ncbi:hypothetical protein L202_01049 [Cryptococcus amylolentus CBS 6039]|uniref:Uncharacterized protein n=2 Tax=Cryptococcus amylolentus TaxID=104669 RepID=A0A1E3I4M1_9TREE|nr:hypothetical protein L202_01049 [Cryptococcus amylolentus CBS 6039]ODN82771.1 hypothetical protein L202_01049 [Cryptococcus amylolentus CBS 6039]ODO10444.1 hypothetical protein I350_01039 [Cryptococcus amylolentus CBS 6273]
MNANGAAPVPHGGRALPLPPPNTFSDAEITKAFEVLVNAMDSALAAFTRKDDASRHLVKLCSFPDANPCHPVFDAAQRAAKEARQQHEAAMVSARAAFQELVWLMIVKAGGVNDLSALTSTTAPAMPAGVPVDILKALSDHKKTLEDQFGSANTVLESKLAQQLAQRFEAFQKTIKAESEREKQDYDMEADALRGMMSEVKSVKVIFEEGMAKVRSLEKWQQDRDRADALKAKEYQVAAELAAKEAQAASELAAKEVLNAAQLPTPSTAQFPPSHPNYQQLPISRVVKQEMVDRLDFLENEVAMQREEIDAMEARRQRKRKRAQDDGGEGKAAAGPAVGNGKNKLWEELKRLQEELQKLKAPAEIPTPAQTSSAPSPAARIGSAPPTNASPALMSREISTLLRSVDKLERSEAITQEKLKALAGTEEARKTEIAKVDKLESAVEGWERKAQALVKEHTAEIAGKLEEMRSTAMRDKGASDAKLSEMGAVLQRTQSSLKAAVSDILTKTMESFDRDNASALTGLQTNINNLRATLQEHATFIATISGQDGADSSIAVLVNTLSQNIDKCLRACTDTMLLFAQLRDEVRNNGANQARAMQEFGSAVTNRIGPTEGEVGRMRSRIEALEMLLQQESAKEEQMSVMQTQLFNLQMQIHKMAQLREQAQSSSPNNAAQTQNEATRRLVQELQERAKQLDKEKAEREEAVKRERDEMAKQQKEMKESEERLVERCMKDAREEMEKTVAELVQRELRSMKEARQAQSTEGSDFHTPDSLLLLESQLQPFDISPAVGLEPLPPVREDDMDGERPVTPPVPPPAQAELEKSREPSRDVEATAVGEQSAVEQPIRSPSTSPPPLLGQSNPVPPQSTPIPGQMNPGQPTVQPLSISLARPSSSGSGSSKAASDRSMAKFFNDADRTGSPGMQVGAADMTARRTESWMPTREDSQQAPVLHLSREPPPHLQTTTPPVSAAGATNPTSRPSSSPNPGTIPRPGSSSGTIPRPRTHSNSGTSNSGTKPPPSGFNLNPSTKPSPGFSLPQGSRLPQPPPGAIPSKPKHNKPSTPRASSYQSREGMSGSERGRDWDRDRARPGSYDHHDRDRRPRDGGGGRCLQ